jgi:hypothetical protein
MSLEEIFLQLTGSDSAAQPAGNESSEEPIAMSEAGPEAGAEAGPETAPPAETEVGSGATAAEEPHA